VPASAHNTSTRLQERREETTHVDTSGSTITRKGEAKNPAYVLTMDQGKKAGKVVLKKGSELHAVEESEPDESEASEPEASEPEASEADTMEEDIEMTSSADD